MLCNENVILFGVLQENASLSAPGSVDKNATIKQRRRAEDCVLSNAMAREFIPT